MNMSDCVSIIMPAYNSSAFIEESIKSVLAQTYAHWELIIIDDGSTDATEEVVRPYLKDNVKILYFKQENRGQAITRNKGIEVSKGPFLAFLDSDDYWLPNTLEILVETIKKEEVDFVFCSFSRLVNGQILDEPLSEFPAGKISSLQMMAILRLYNPLVIHGVLTYRAHVAQVGGFEISPMLMNCSEDYSLWIRLALSGKTFFGLPLRLAVYRRHPGGTHANRVKMLEAEIYVHTKYRGSTPKDLLISRRLLRSKYRRLISAYIEMGQTELAKNAFSRLRTIDNRGLPGTCINILSQLLPFGTAHKIGTKFLYPIEYRVSNMLYGRWKDVFAKYKNEVLQNK